MKRKIKFFYQKITRGFSEEDLWSLDISLANWLLPRLKEFVRITNFNFTKEKQKDFEEIIWMLEEIQKCNINNTERFEKAKILFGNYINRLWF